MIDKTCYWCTEALSPLRVTWQPASDQHPVIEFHEPCAKAFVQALGQGMRGPVLCLTCGEPLNAQRITKRYCDKSCQASARRARQRTRDEILREVHVA